jgi:LysR family glycine cleavage system transcriptional activator
MMHSLPPLDALQAVLSAAASGSFSAAAETLDVTHGSISRRVASVEQWAGIAIFKRHGRGVRPTLDGQRLIAQIERAISLLEDGGLVRHRRPELDVVRVGVVQSFARLWLIPHLAALEGSPPDLRIEAEIDDGYMTLSDARVGIRLGRGQWPGVVAQRLFPETLTPCASPAVAQAIGPDASPESLLACPLIHDASDANWHYWLSQAGVDYERRPQDRTFPGYDLALLAAARGHGVVLARDPYGRAFCAQLGLQPVARMHVRGTEAFHVVAKPGLQHPAVERLIARVLALSADAGADLPA